MSNHLPCLGPEGWLPQGQKMLNLLAAHMYCSDYSQSTLFYRLVSSVAWVVKENQADLEAQRRGLTQMMESYFSTYFKNVEVNLYVIDTLDSALRGELVMSAYMEDVHGQPYQLHEAMTRQGNVTRTVLDYLDTGVLS